MSDVSDSNDFQNLVGESASYDEWHATVAGSTGTMGGQRFFRQIDSDGDRSISIAEFERALAVGVVSSTESGYQIGAHIASSDTDGVADLIANGPANGPVESPGASGGGDGDGDGRLTVVNLNAQRSAIFLNDAKGEAFVDALQGMEHKPDVLVFQEFAYDKNSQGWVHTGTGEEINSLEEDVLPLIAKGLGVRPSDLHYHANFQGMLTIAVSPLEISGVIEGSHGRMSYAVIEIEGEKVLVINVHFSPGSPKLKRAQELDAFVEGFKAGEHRDLGLNPDTVDSIIFSGDVNWKNDQEIHADEVLFGDDAFELNVKEGVDRIANEGLNYQEGGIVETNAQVSDHPMLFASYTAD